MVLKMENCQIILQMQPDKKIFENFLNFNGLIGILSHESWQIF